jgi:hypothetical protein
MSNGWSAVITSPGAGGELNRSSYMIAIAERQAAEQALQKKLTAANQKIEMVAEIPAKILNEEGIAVGTIWGIF